ncbi:C-C motif chemokine 4-like [Lacerta agilis]|uniref:C-C motif chemokine 4-like n=1 Tax=Lacerta agilis TaxID=80427 RepID=UPI0014198AFF|nr:C-C motif chemokine 4-like [Lacerta agilis]
MKLFLVALPFLLLVLAAASPREYAEEFKIHDKSVPSGGLVRMDPSPLCCTDYSKKIFPRDKVKDYFYTSSDCRLRSVVFVFKNGKSGCANPNAQWAKDLIEYIDSIKNSTSSNSTTVPTPSA